MLTIKTRWTQFFKGREESGNSTLQSLDKSRNIEKIGAFIPSNRANITVKYFSPRLSSKRLRGVFLVKEIIRFKEAPRNRFQPVSPTYNQETINSQIPKE